MSCAMTAAVLRGKALNLSARIMWTGEPENVCRGLVSHCVQCETNEVTFVSDWWCDASAAPSVLPKRRTAVLARLMQCLGRHEMGIVRLIALDLIARQPVNHIFTFQCIVGVTWPWPALSFSVPHRRCHRRCSRCPMCTLNPPSSVRNLMVSECLV